MRFALDTNISIAALNGVGSVLARLEAVPIGDVLIPDLVVAELLFGARTSTRVAENVARIERLLSSFATAPFELAAAKRFGGLKADLRARGIAKQDFDLAIACVAIENDATLVTHDAALLAGDIVGLTAEDWLI